MLIDGGCDRCGPLSPGVESVAVVTAEAAGDRVGYQIVKDGAAYSSVALAFSLGPIALELGHHRCVTEQAAI